MKIRLVRAELFHADGRIDGQMTKQIAAFRSFVNAPKMDSWAQFRTTTSKNSHLLDQIKNW